MVFLVVKYGCESWTIKKAECRRTDAFELWCWRRLLRVPWTARRSNLSIVKKINIGRTDAEVEASILWPPDAKSRLTRKDPNAGKVFVTQSCPILGDPMDYIAHQVPLSVEFSRQEYLSGLLFPSPGDLPNPGIEPGSPTLQADA